MIGRGTISTAGVGRNNCPYRQLQRHLVLFRQAPDRRVFFFFLFSSPRSQLPRLAGDDGPYRIPRRATRYSILHHAIGAAHPHASRSSVSENYIPGSGPPWAYGPYGQQIHRRTRTSQKKNPCPRPSASLDSSFRARPCEMPPVPPRTRVLDAVQYSTAASDLGNSGVARRHAWRGW